MKILFSSLLVLCAAATLRAQEIPPMPDGPPIELRAAELSAWTITLVPGGAVPSSSAPAPAPTAPAPAQKPFFGSFYTITKTGKIMKRETADDRGQIWSSWCFPDMQITVYPDGKSAVLQTRPAHLGFPNPFYVDYSTTDFPDFWWVSTSNYAGIRIQAGKKCLYFKDKLKFYSDDMTPSALEAYVDLKTRLPVLLIVGPATRTYTFLPPPTEQLTLPPLVQKMLKDRNKAILTATRRLPLL